MARPRSNKLQNKGKGTAFGKQSDAEKSFRKRGRSSRAEDSKRSFRPAGSSFRSERPTPSDVRRNEGGPGRRESAKAPFKKNFKSYDKPDFRETSGKSFGPRTEREDSRGNKPFRKGADSSFRPRPEGPPRFSKPSGTRRDSDPDSHRDDRDKKSFGEKRERSFHSATGWSPPKRGGNPYSHRDDRDKKSFGKKSPESFGPPSFSKKPSTRSDSDRNEKPFRKKEQKSFVQSRVIKSGDFTKVVRTEAPKKDDGLTRLNKYIANSGVGSRREADELIKMGLIKVNGTTITELGTKVKPGDEVRYEDRVLKAEKPVYILLNKPKGFITTTDDPQERNTVMGLVAGACKERIYPVGRLDRNTTGLLLLTNDGDLADKLTHPSYKAKKVYKAELDRPLTKNDFQKVMDGVQLEEGRAMVDDLAIISDDHKTVGLEIHIGWNRVVRRIFEALGYEVGKLDRSVFAGLDKKDLSRGQWRFLKPEEVVRLTNNLKQTK